MKILSNRNGSYVTGTAIADAVLRYGHALAKTRDIDVVDIPFVAADGLPARVQLTVGWCADVNTAEHPAHDAELIDEAVTEDLDAKADGLTRGSVPFTTSEVADLSWMGWC
ncbi:MAG TPA: hypothetical protein VFY91_12260 [Microbacterium sp.]|nr:hypothetical protein [Microbacterium sp.]